MRKLALAGVILCLLCAPMSARTEKTAQLCVQLSRGSAILEIFSYEGAPIATICADPKGAVRLSLPEGVYIAQTESGRAVFELTREKLFVCSGAARLRFGSAGKITRYRRRARASASFRPCPTGDMCSMKTANRARVSRSAPPARRSS